MPNPADRATLPGPPPPPSAALANPNSTTKFEQSLNSINTSGNPARHSERNVLRPVKPATETSGLPDASPVVAPVKAATGPLETPTPDGKGGWLEGTAVTAADQDGGKLLKRRIKDAPAEGKIVRENSRLAEGSIAKAAADLVASVLSEVEAGQPAAITAPAKPSTVTNPVLPDPKAIAPSKPSDAKPGPSRPSSVRKPAAERDPQKLQPTPPVEQEPPIPAKPPPTQLSTVPEEQPPESAVVPEAPPAEPDDEEDDEKSEKSDGKEKEKKKKKKKDREHKKHRRKGETTVEEPEPPKPALPPPTEPPPPPPTVADVEKPPVPDPPPPKPTEPPAPPPTTSPATGPTIGTVEMVGPDDAPTKSKVARPPLVLTPSDAAAFEKPEPPAELGPVRKPLTAPPRKPPQTALTVSATNQRKFGQSSTAPTATPKLELSMTQFGTSAVSDDAINVPTVKKQSGESIPAAQPVIVAVAPEEEKEVKSLPEVSEKRKKKEKKEKKKKKRDEEAPVETAIAEPAPEAPPPPEPIPVEDKTESGATEPLAPEALEPAQPPEDPVPVDPVRKKKKKKKGADVSASDDDEKRVKSKKKRRGSAAGESKDRPARDAAGPAKPEAPPAKVDELIGKAVGNFFILEDVLGKGGFGEARRGRHITTGKKYAIKLERTAGGNESLADEYKIYQLLGQHTGFPRCYYFGSGPKENNALVMDLLGPSLEDYFRAMERKWSLKTVCIVALQVLERIEYVHSKGYVYSDIKPENFLVGLAGEKQDSVIFLIDFGLAQQFKDKETGKYCYDENLKTHPVGTMRYMSVRSHEARSLSYRDDLESIGYLVIYFLRAKLPWQGMAMKDRQKKVKAVGLQKKNMSVEELCQGCPPELQDYMKYVRSIQFYAEPKYERLRTFFHNILSQNKWTDDGMFDWVGNVYDFGKNKKSESVIGAGAKAASGAAVAAAAGAEAGAEDKAGGKKAEGETTVTPLTEDRSRKGVKKKKKRKKHQKAENEAPKGAEEPAAPVVPLKKAAPGLAAAGLPTTFVNTTGADPGVDPIIAFTEREAERPLRASPSAATTPREKRLYRAKDDSTCNCC